VEKNLHRELEHVHDESMEHEANWKRRLATAVEKRLAMMTKLIKKTQTQQNGGEEEACA
jgi:hypothetical protein